MVRISRSQEGLEKALTEQLEMLEVLCDSYDSGKTNSAKLIAAILRILLHDTRTCHSLLFNQLKRRTQLFFDSTCGILDTKIEQGEISVGGASEFVGVAMGGDGGYIPYLDSLPEDVRGFVPFAEFWERKVLKDGNGNIFTRKDIILTLAEQDGGVHLDPAIDEKYNELVLKNSMGWKASNYGKEVSITGIELAVARQIGHEVLKSLKNIPKKEMQIRGAGAVIGAMRVVTERVAECNMPISEYSAIQKVGMGKKCPCGSRKKYKRCHGVPR